MKKRNMENTQSPTVLKLKDQALAEIVRRLIAAYEPERIYLFGSRARGDSGANSDYDLMVVVPDSAPPERMRSRLAYQVLRGTGTAADVLVWSREAFECRLHLRASLPYAVVSEGTLLYEARSYSD
jgi:predicted nucleotidyltransferase